MLIPLSERLSADERLVYAVLQPDLVAFCPESGARLKVSLGHPRDGRPRRYWLRVPQKAPARWDEPPPGAFVDEDHVSFRAASSIEAIEKGNQRLRRLLNTGLSVRILEPPLSTLCHGVVRDASGTAR